MILDWDWQKKLAELPFKKLEPAYVDIFTFAVIKKLQLICFQSAKWLWY